MLAKVFDGLAQMSRDVAQNMAANNRNRVTVEYWKATQAGIGAAQRFLLASHAKASGAAKPEIAEAIATISSRSQSHARRRGSAATTKQ